MISKHICKFVVLIIAASFLKLGKEELKPTFCKNIWYYQIRIENKVGKKVTLVTHRVRNWCNQNSNYAI